MERNYFDRLPAELITPILLQLPTTKSLYSLIRASPRAYQVFLASKGKILISVMRRTIQPVAFFDALAAVKASQLREKGPNRREVLAFLRKYENRRHKCVTQEMKLLDATTAVSLCQLYRSTHCFIYDLASRSNFYLRRCGDTRSKKIHSTPRGDFNFPKMNGFDDLWRGKEAIPADRNFIYVPLSETEEGRLQRAFYRYELYAQIFSSDMEYNGEKLWELPSDSHFFLKKYQHWELEELSCVADYLRSLLFNCFDRIESSFEGVQLPKPPLNDDVTSFRSYKRSQDLREAKFQIHSLYMDYLTSLSLPIIHHALSLDRWDIHGRCLLIFIMTARSVLYRLHSKGSGTSYLAKIGNLLSATIPQLLTMTVSVSKTPLMDRTKVGSACMAINTLLLRSVFDMSPKVLGTCSGIVSD